MAHGAIQDTAAELRVKSFLGEECYVTPGVLDESVKDVFMNGQCVALGLALAERYGYSLWLLTVGNEGINQVMLDAGGKLKRYPEIVEDEDLYKAWEHCVVKVGRDQYLDAAGVHSRDELLDEWWGTYRKGQGVMYYLVPTTPEQIVRIYTTYVEEYPYTPDVEAGRLFAEAVVDEYLGHQKFQARDPSTEEVSGR